MEQGRVFRLLEVESDDELAQFQSLWNRARSFDYVYFFTKQRYSSVSIPLEQGGVFRLNLKGTVSKEELVSIPLEQGRVFRLNSPEAIEKETIGLNPFGTGQGLSTAVKRAEALDVDVSIPLEQGRVFRHRSRVLNA